MSEKTLAVQQEEPSIGGMLQAVIKQGVTSENVAALDKLADLYERMEDKKAERAFAAAFVALQSEMSVVKATRPVPAKDGTIKYKFAPYEDIMEQVKPLLLKHGFSVTFDMEYIGEGRLKSICVLMHEGGHKRVNSFAVRIGGGPPGANETQSDGAAKTYAKRGALSDALNIVTEKDTDGDDTRGEGKQITQEQADDLRRRVKATKADEKKFLAFAQAATFEDIHEANFAMLDAQLKKREATKTPAHTPEHDGPDISF